MIMIDRSLFEIKAREAYGEVVELSSRNNAPPYFQKISREYHQGSWKVYYELLRATGITIKDKIVVDFGCKYGHLLPLLILLGVRRAIGIDVEPEYIELGKRFFERTSPEKIQILPCEDGLIPLQSETVDFVFMNEVISHINPSHLDLVLQEISRTLRTGGALFISDGNNIANGKCRRKLLNFWDKWENGPDGVRTDRDVVNKCYLTRRKEIIFKRHPELDEEKVNLLAVNTSGLWGDQFVRVVDEFVRSGNLIQRNYRRGICPTNPSNTGVVIERGFHPFQVELLLRNYGLEAHQLPPKLFSEGKNLKVKLKALCVLIVNILLPGWYKRLLQNFSMIGIKSAKDVFIPEANSETRP